MNKCTVFIKNMDKYMIGEYVLISEGQEIAHSFDEEEVIKEAIEVRLRGKNMSLFV